MDNSRTNSIIQKFLAVKRLILLRFYKDKFIFIRCNILNDFVRNQCTLKQLNTSLSKIIKTSLLQNNLRVFSTRFLVVIELTSAVVIHLFIMQTARHVDFYPSLPLQTPCYIMPIFRVLFCGRYGHY